MGRIIYLFIFISTLCLLVSCGKNNTVTYIDYITKSLDYEETTPINKKDFEGYLSSSINKNMYYYIQDYNVNYVGLTVDYIAVASYINESNMYQIQIFINPPIKSKLPSTMTYMLLYEDMKLYTGVTIGTFGSNLLNTKYDESTGLSNTLKSLEEQNYKIWFCGKITINEISKPDFNEFKDKQKIINNIYKWLDDNPSFLEIKDAKRIMIYIQDFGEQDAHTSVLLIPDTGVQNGIQLDYNIVNNSGNETRPLNYADLSLDDEIINNRITHFVNKVIEHSASSKEIVIDK